MKKSIVLILLWLGTNSFATSFWPTMAVGTSILPFTKSGIMSCDIEMEYDVLGVNDFIFGLGIKQIYSFEFTEIGTLWSLPLYLDASCPIKKDFFNVGNLLGYVNLGASLTKVGLWYRDVGTLIVFNGWQFYSELGIKWQLFQEEKGWFLKSGIRLLPTYKIKNYRELDNTLNFNMSSFYVLIGIKL